MIYIVEIPHQRKPFAWCAEDEDDFIYKLAIVHRRRSAPSMNAPLADWIAYNASDLYAQHVFMNAADAIEGLDLIGGHGAVEAVADLRCVLVATGALPDVEEVAE